MLLSSAFEINFCLIDPEVLLVVVTFSEIPRRPIYIPEAQMYSLLIVNFSFLDCQNTCQFGICGMNLMVVLKLVNQKN